MASVLIAPPASQYCKRAGWVEAQIAAFADDSGPHLAGVDTHPVVRSIPDVHVLLARRLDVGTDASVVEEIHRCPKDASHHLFSADFVRFEAQGRLHLLRDVNSFGRSIEDAAALTD